MTKPRMKLLTGIVGVVTAVALVGGGTMAWFTDQKEVAGSTFTAGTVKIQAGQSVVNDTDEKGNPIYYEDAAPLRVYDVHRGTGKNDTPLPKLNTEVRSFPDAILTRADESTSPSEDELYSMGFGGDITVELKTGLLKGDILVVEGTWNNSQKDYVETADVFVSADGTDWKPAGTVSNQTDPKGNFHDSMVAIPIPNAKYVKLVDTTLKILPNGKKNKSEDGFDIDYICGRNILDEVNWNPGDTNKLAFYVQNSGTKDIDVRVKLESHWETWNEETQSWEAADALTDADPSMVILSNPKGWTKVGDFYYCDQEGLRGTYGGETPEAAGQPTNAALDLTVTLSTEAGNEYQNARLVVTPTFQAIQYSHSDEWNWDGFDGYNSSTPAE
ncbi:TasA family protein [Caproiciproducens faecalis]|uniref:Camelysin metallo-endopeptidase n=1 Tax=Caproiciproducens faecalis TaxID=2820301 RepID=A0ABS7DK16_9FIRM|nr:TasA family protein [Caproiciproducens faecalis]MBW7571635.1 hypothetical protein [Caproiciproducens faecalis]